MAVEDEEDTEGNRRRVRRTVPMAVEDEEDTEGNRRINA